MWRSLGLRGNETALANIIKPYLWFRWKKGFNTRFFCDCIGQWYSRNILLLVWHYGHFSRLYDVKSVIMVGGGWQRLNWNLWIVDRNWLLNFEWRCYAICKGNLISVRCVVRVSQDGCLLLRRLMYLYLIYRVYSLLLVGYGPRCVNLHFFQLMCPWVLL